MAKIYKLRRTSTLALRQRKAALLKRLVVPPHFLRTSYVERFTTCGKSNCACAQGQKHGPFYYLASGLAQGHVLKFLLKTPAQQHNGEQGVAAYKGKISHDTFGYVSDHFDPAQLRRGARWIKHKINVARHLRPANSKDCWSSAWMPMQTLPLGQGHLE